MATRRMFNKFITNSAKFLKMPLESQALYFHLAQNADDDGVVEGFAIMRIAGASEDSLKILAAKGYIKVLNEDLVIFVVHWLDHNQIRTDRKVDSIYKDLLLQEVPETKLLPTRPRADRQKKTNVGTSHGQPMDNQWTEEGSIVQVSLGKEKDYCEKIVDFYHEKCSEMSKVIKLTAPRKKSINARIKDYSVEQVERVIEMAGQSNFLSGKNDKGWTANLDWLMTPSKFVKVLEGNYENKVGTTGKVEQLNNFKQRDDDYSELDNSIYANVGK